MTTFSQRQRQVLSLTYWISLLCVATTTAPAQEADLPPCESLSAWQAAGFRWQVSDPLLAAVADRLPPSPENPWVAVKDPSIVRVQDRWHLFCSLRKQKGGQGRIRIGYLSFSDWKQAPRQTWSVLNLTDDYHGAPQIFYFRPQKKWYLVYQAADQARSIPYGPCFSTTSTLDQPETWTLPQPMNAIPDGQKKGLDYWVICNDRHAYLFYTTLDGRMWRTRTRLADFPARGWSRPEVALRGDIFEASHTYRLRGCDAFLTIVEAQNGPRRYYKAYWAKRLDDQWHPLADSKQRPFIAPANVVNQSESWTTSYSHGELLRTGYDERLEVNPKRLVLLFQGVNDADRAGKNYGAIPWRLGMATLVD